MDKMFKVIQYFLINYSFSNLISCLLLCNSFQIMNSSRFLLEVFPAGLYLVSFVLDWSCTTSETEDSDWSCSNLCMNFYLLLILLVLFVTGGSSSSESEKGKFSMSCVKMFFFRLSFGPFYSGEENLLFLMLPMFCSTSELWILISQVAYFKLF